MSVEKTSTRCVWLVDDDDEDLLLMRAAFNSVDPGIEIRTMADGDELLPQLQRTQPFPDLILIDLNMIYVDGFEALRQVRALSQFSHLPVVVLTTSSNVADRQKSTALGADDFHTKPDSFTDLAQLARDLTRQWLPEPLA
ncbi:response regulator [Fibrella sp. HMF5335]|uniref:Response regulator n=1 Tax=Fibrella rubiginis TaxID=2817060 RepID=A0A939GGX1_9BACT|nr:response regulator [Fibrella rubiginis]MBO0937004.1 response regulator [Fibrella rubiginis]